MGPAFAMKKKLFVFIAACLMGGVFYAASSITVVVLYDDRGGERFRFSPPDGRFTIRFLHSWARSPVDEVFQVDDGHNIVLKETIYEDFGAGLPHEPEPGRPPSSMTVENGKIRIRDIDRVISDLQIRASRFVAAHTLIYGDKLVPFSDFAVPGSVVIFKVQSMKRCALWIEEIKNSM